MRHIPALSLLCSLATISAACADSTPAPGPGETNADSSTCVVEIRATPDDEGDDTAAIQAGLNEAIELAHRAGRRCVATLAPGVYRLSARGNRPADREALRVADAEGLTIRGPGATLELHSPEPARFGKLLTIVRSRNITVEALTFRWSHLPVVTAKVIAAYPASRWLDLEVLSDLPVPRPDGNGRLVRRLYHLRGPDRLVGINSRINFHPGPYPWKTRRTTAGYQVQLPERSQAALRQVRVGDEYAIFHSVYGHDAIFFARVQGLWIRDVNIHTVGGIGIWGEWSSDIDIEGVALQPDPRDPTASYSATADGIHLVHNRGRVRIADSLLARSGDDAINVSSIVMQIRAIEGGRRTVTGQFAQRTFPPLVGDELRAIDRHGRSYPGSWRVTAVAPARPGAFRIDLDRALPPAVTSDDRLINATWQPSGVAITGNHVYGTRGRGVLLHARNSWIADNTFRSISGPAILMSHKNRRGAYYHGPFGDHVTIHGNAFIDTPRGIGASTIALHSEEDVDLGAPGTYGIPSTVHRVHHDITIRHNQFRGGSGPAIHARNTSSLWLNSNTFDAVGWSCGPPWNVRCDGTISIDHGRDISVWNSCNGRRTTDGACRPRGTAALHIGASTVQTSRGNNAGFVER